MDSLHRLGLWCSVAFAVAPRLLEQTYALAAAGRVVGHLPLEALIRVLRVRLLLIHLRSFLPITLRGTGCLPPSGHLRILLERVLLGLRRRCTPGQLEVAMYPRVTRQVIQIKVRLADAPGAMSEATRMELILGEVEVHLLRRPVTRHL